MPTILVVNASRVLLLEAAVDGQVSRHEPAESELAVRVAREHLGDVLPGGSLGHLGLLDILASLHSSLLLQLVNRRRVVDDAADLVAEHDKDK